MDAVLAHQRRDGRRGHPARRPPCSTCRRRTSSSRRPTATSATRRRAASRSARPSPADRSRRTAPGRGRAGTAGTSGRGFVDPADHAARARPRRGVHRHRQPGRHPGRRRALPDRRLGLRLPRAADPRPAQLGHGRRQGRRRRTWPDPGRPAQPVRGRAGPGRCSRWTSTTRSTTTGRSCCAPGTGCSRRTRRRRRTSRPSGPTSCRRRSPTTCPTGTAPRAAHAGSRWSVGSRGARLAVVGRQVDARRGRGARRGADPRDGLGAPRS